MMNYEDDDSCPIEDESEDILNEESDELNIQDLKTF